MDEAQLVEVSRKLIEARDMIRDRPADIPAILPDQLVNQAKNWLWETWYQHLPGKEQTERRKDQVQRLTAAQQDRASMRRMKVFFDKTLGGEDIAKMIIRTGVDRLDVMHRALGETNEHRT